MNFAEEIKKTLICFGEKINIFKDNKKLEGYSLFKKIAKNKEELLADTQQDKIGAIVCSTYLIWVYCKKNLEKIDYIVKDNKKYIPLYQKYNKEIGCLQLIVVEKS